MKGCSPAADEERAAMVPLPPPAEDEIIDEYMAAEHTKPCWTMKAGGCVGVAMAIFALLALLVGTKWIHLDAAYYTFLPAGTGFSKHGSGRSPTAPQLVPIPLSCSNDTDTSSPTTAPAAAPSSSPSKRRYYPGVPPPWCPDYFRHIHTDMEPWRATGITRDAVELAQPHAEFRLVVVSGRAYVEKYHDSFQTRDIFTQWGILQLLARYPGRVPDVDIMFSTGDSPRVLAAEYPSRSAAPPLFRYCKEESQELAILFPDWSFWGWPEINIRPWAPLMEELVRENARLPWPDREPYAFWKGNPDVSEVRRDLFRCNNDTAAGKEWNTRVFKQDWNAAGRNGFRDSDLAKQCRYRYKIYVQGHSWSVSEK